MIAGFGFAYLGNTRFNGIRCLVVVCIIVVVVVVVVRGENPQAVAYSAQPLCWGG